MIAPCGNGCADCPRYQATLSGNALSLSYVADLWFRLGFRDHVGSNAEMVCRGCPPRAGCPHGIAECAGARGIGCGACAELPGCARVAGALDRADGFVRRLRSKCTKAEYAVLERAFFHKRENLAHRG